MQPICGKTARTRSDVLEAYRDADDHQHAVFVGCTGKPNSRLWSAILFEPSLSPFWRLPPDQRNGAAEAGDHATRLIIGGTRDLFAQPDHPETIRDETKANCNSSLSESDLMNSTVSLADSGSLSVTTVDSTRHYLR